MKAAVLAGVTLAVWIATAPAAALLDGPLHWTAATVAAVLCLLPALGTLAFVERMAKRSPVEALGAVMAAPLVRMIVVLVFAAAAWRVVPGFRSEPIRFGAWVLAFYLVTLVAETALLLPRAGRPGPGVVGDS